jgi:hypothetical protein
VLSTQFAGFASRKVKSTDTDTALKRAEKRRGSRQQAAGELTGRRAEERRGSRQQAADTQL